MSDFDNRIDFTQVPVDFSRFESTGQGHDEYPSPNTAARFDLMRQYLIGLLSNQSCDEVEDGEPNEKRTGTIWYKTRSESLDLFDGEAFKSIANFISVNAGEDVVKLQDVLDSILNLFKYIEPRFVWSGSFVTDTTTMPIPTEYQEFVSTNFGIMLYINGLLIDPRLVEIVPGNPAYIRLSSEISKNSGKDYTIVMQHVTQIKNEDVPARG